MTNDKQRLVELLGGAKRHETHLTSSGDFINLTRCIVYKDDASELADYLLENGVIVPPCKVGDIVYTNIHGTTLQNSFIVNSVDLLGFSNGTYSWTWHQLGKSVFLTREEAEKAMKEGCRG